jgi:iron complex transport system ATP-binding protein
MLEALDVGVERGRTRALDAVSLALAPGEVLGLVGPNGAGKSTLLACLSGALRPSDGRVRLDGEDPARLSAADLARRRAVLEQTPESAAPFRLAELVALAIPREVPPDAAERMVADALAATDLAALAERPLDRLSGGERHRAHMARALAQHHAGRAAGLGRWLLLDEPTASLDLAHQAAVVRAARTAARAGAGVLAVLHDLTLAAAMADRIALLQAGRLIEIGPPAEVLTEHRLAAVYGVPVAVHPVTARQMAVTPLYAHEAPTTGERRA